jgi:hypothetical protein
VKRGPVCPIFIGLAFASMSLGQTQGTTNQRSNNDYALLNSHIVTIKGIVHRSNRYFSGPNKGQPAPDTCEISLSLGPNERALEARGNSPTRVNPDGTCELEMEVGTPPDSTLPKYNAKPPTPDLAPRGVTAAASPGTSSGYAQGWVTDPVKIWVNSEQINISWKWSGVPQTCASLYSYSEGVPASFAGWYKVYQDVYPITECVYDSTTDVFYTEAGGGAYVDWQDNSWPGCTTAANSYYWPIYAVGDNFGNLSGDYAWELTGSGPGCINLLTPNFQLIRTYN